MTTTDRHNDSQAERTPVQFTLRSLFLVFVLVWSSLALFGLWGIPVAAYLLVLVIRYRSGHRNALRWLAAGTMLLVFAVLLYPAVEAARDTGYPRRCWNNLKWIGLALQNYDSFERHFPPAYIADEDGKPMHSWRVLILPYMDLKLLYDAYDFDEPWNGPNNRELADMMPREFRCPNDPDGGAPYTNYVAVVGPETAWPGADCVSTGEIPDGTSRTIMVFEVGGDQKFHWMEPRDITWEDVVRSLDPESEHRVAFCNHVRRSGQFELTEWVGAWVCLADGSVQVMDAEQDPKTLEALLTIDGGEDVDLENLVPPKVKSHPNWPRIITSITALAVLLVTFGLLLFWPLRKRADALPDDAHAAEADEERVDIAEERFSDLDKSGSEDAS